MEYLEMLDKVFTNNDGSDFIIQGSTKDKRGKTIYKVYFPVGNYATLAYKTKILIGAVKNPYHPKVEGIGYLGNAAYKGNEKEYQIWRSILKRCYNPNATDYSSYGAKGISVDKDWHSFGNFLRDIPSIDGYNGQLFKEGKLELDKDLKSDSNKIYSKETCTFISRYQNQRIIDHHVVKFIAISPEGERYESENVSSFAKEHQLNPANIINALKGRYKTHHGWTFEYR